MFYGGPHCRCTGAANGIGHAMAVRFAAEDAKQVSCADPDLQSAEETCKNINGFS